jgi:hypothetical protein
MRNLAVSEQDQYATAHLFRAIANTEGHTTHMKVPIWPIQVPSAEMADLVQSSYIALRHST